MSILKAGKAPELAGIATQSYTRDRSVASRSG